MAITKAPNRVYTVTVADNGNSLEIGPPATQQCGAMVVQTFGAGFTGSFTVQGRVYGEDARKANVPLVAVPYRKVSLAGVAADYSIVAAALTGDCIIQVPANGLSIALLIACTAGTSVVAVWDIEGCGAP